MEKELTYGEDYGFIPATSVNSGMGIEVAPGVYSYTIQIVNIVLVEMTGTNGFVLIDAGMPGSAKEIADAVSERFGADRRPEAILLTHGHFDHVGALIELVREWDVPVYAHEAELPYLTGKQSYPEPDPSVEGGLVAKLSMLFPNEPVDVGDRVQVLPADGSVPFLPDFRWIPTPGHTPGHVSFFREKDRVLIAGDAFVTVKQESLYSVFTQELELHGPPRYFTTDWQAAEDSVRRLEALKPEIAVTGHGMPIAGDRLARDLKQLVDTFEQVAIPDYGRYVDDTPQTGDRV